MTTKALELIRPVDLRNWSETTSLMSAALT